MCGKTRRRDVDVAAPRASPRRRRETLRRECRNCPVSSDARSRTRGVRVTAPASVAGKPVGSSSFGSRVVGFAGSKRCLSRQTRRRAFTSTRATLKRAARGADWRFRDVWVRKRRVWSRSNTFATSATSPMCCLVLWRVKTEAGGNPRDFLPPTGIPIFTIFRLIGRRVQNINTFVLVNFCVRNLKQGHTTRNSRMSRSSAPRVSTRRR